MTDPTQLHQGSAGRTADKPQGAAFLPRLKNSPTVAELRSQLADAAMAWASLERECTLANIGMRAWAVETCRVEGIMRDLAAKIEALS